VEWHEREKKSETLEAIVGDQKTVETVVKRRPRTRRHVVGKAEDQKRNWVHTKTGRRRGAALGNAAGAKMKNRKKTVKRLIPENKQFKCRRG